MPVYFPGRNRRAFHLASHIAEPLRMALLLSEAGIVSANHWTPWSAIHLAGRLCCQCDNRQSLTDYLYDQVQSLADTLPIPMCRSPHPAARRQKNETPDLKRTRAADIEPVWMTCALPHRSR